MLVIGGGAREHALAWRLKSSASVEAVWTTHPRNPGLKSLCRSIDFEFSLRELYRLEQLCRREKIDLVVVGPEDPLAAGVADELTAAGVAVFGPARDAAALEADKSFAKALMRGASIPTAEARTFEAAEEAAAYTDAREEPPVIKASGLAAGKGVFLPGSREECRDVIRRLLVERALGAAGDKIVIEERLAGPEVSLFALVDGRNILMLDACQDHKRLGDGDTGPNTGGMGAYCPTPVIDGRTLALAERDIIVPTVDALRREAVEYRGVLYAGLILTHGGPKVLEFNVRFGDPEAQCLVRRIGGDFGRLLYAASTGLLHELTERDVASTGQHVCCVVLASGGYPGDYQKGLPIEGVDDAEAVEGVTVFFAGAERLKGEGLVTAGGRVLSVVGAAPTLAAARDRAYEAASLIRFEGKTVRTDIAHQALQSA